MKKTRFQAENGKMEINGHLMEWQMMRSKSSSAFGIRGSRIFQLTLKKDGAVIGEYAYGWSKKISDEDEEGALCLSYLVDKYGKDIPRKKKEMGSLV